MVLTCFDMFFVAAWFWGSKSSHSNSKSVGWHSFNQEHDRAWKHKWSQMFLKISQDIWGKAFISNILPARAHSDMHSWGLFDLHHLSSARPHWPAQDGAGSRSSQRRAGHCDKPSTALWSCQERCFLVQHPIPLENFPTSTRPLEVVTCGKLLPSHGPWLCDRPPESIGWGSARPLSCRSGRPAKGHGPPLRRPVHCGIRHKELRWHPPAQTNIDMTRVWCDLCPQACPQGTGSLPDAPWVDSGLLVAFRFDKLH